MKCKLCGKEIEAEKYLHGKELEEKQLCCNCDFWVKLLDQDKSRDPHEYAVIKGAHYVLCPSQSNKRTSGFAGHKFKIRFFDGFETICDNLWHQGDVPKRFNINNNAEFIQ